jgi:hypothetical protein
LAHERSVSRYFVNRHAPARGSSAGGDSSRSAGDLPPDPCQGEGGATLGPAETLERTLEAMQRYNIVKIRDGLDLDNVRKRVKAAPDRVRSSAKGLQSSRRRF